MHTPLFVNFPNAKAALFTDIRQFIVYHQELSTIGFLFF